MASLSVAPKASRICVPARTPCYRENRRDCCPLKNQNGKRRVVIVARERGGEAITFVMKTEDAAVPLLHDRIALGSTVYADEANPEAGQSLLATERARSDGN